MGGGQDVVRAIRGANVRAIGRRAVGVVEHPGRARRDRFWSIQRAFTTWFISCRLAPTILFCATRAF